MIAWCEGKKKKYRRTQKDTLGLECFLEMSLKSDIFVREKWKLQKKKRWDLQNLYKSPRWYWLHLIDDSEAILERNLW